jgi:flagella basal body P-ring formation protein FlgA
MIPHFRNVLFWLCVVVSSAIASVVFASEKLPIPVPKHIIYAGQQINPGLLRDRYVPHKYLNRVSVIMNRSEIVGKVAKVTLTPNRPIPSNAITEPHVVNVNVRTVLKFNRGALSITAEVLPLNAAREGETVRARNLQTGVIVFGTAQRDGTLLAGGQG